MTFRSVWSWLVEAASAEWLLRRCLYPNGGDVILLRALWTSIVAYLFALEFKNGWHLWRICQFDWTALHWALVDKMAWFGAIFAGTYATLHARYASQWTYLANVYNRIKETEARGGTCIPEKMAEWKAGFIEDAEDLHLIGKPMFAYVFRTWSKETLVETKFIGCTTNGESRWKSLVARYGSERPTTGKKTAEA
jgi:hypothetical protein